jgi:hypothetical protein
VRIGLSEEICDKLSKPMTKYTRQGPGGYYSYYKGSDVIRRLNEAFNHSWSSERVETSVVDEQVLMLVAITVFVEGDTITHHGYGSASISSKRSMEIGNAYKAAYTNALKKAAEQFGIGLGEEDADEDSTEPKAPSSYKRPPTSAARSYERPPQNTGSSRPPMESPKPLPPRDSEAPAAPAPAGNKLPPGLLALANQIINSTQNTTATTTVPQSEEQVPETKDFPKETVEGDEPLNSAQKLALGRLAKMKRISEAEMIKIALPESTKTSFEDLLKSEAVVVIRRAGRLNPNNLK